jgi:hypothetical protein
MPTRGGHAIGLLEQLFEQCPEGDSPVIGKRGETSERRR